MIVTHLAKFYPPVPGGMERVVESLCRATASRVENRVLAFHTGRTTVREEVEGVAITRVATWGQAGSVPVAPRFFAELRRVRTDLLVLHEPNPWALLACALVRPRAPLVIWYHSDVVRPQLQYELFYRPMARAVYGRTARFIVSSPALAEQATGLAGFESRVSVVPFGIDAGAWTAGPAVLARAAEIRKTLHGRPLVLFTGRMVPYKGVDVLLRSLQGVEAVAVLAGDGPRRGDWMALAAQLGLRGRAKFPGEVSQDELLALYHACDVFVLPSITRAEAFGFVQVEAMVCGKPVVSTRVPSGVPWVNRHEETGLTVPPGDVAALRQALQRLLLDAPLRERLGAAARRRVLETFTVEVMGARAVEVYESAVREGRR
jgi:glycosyltransferase involved in cell wall biosynthesis